MSRKSVDFASLRDINNCRATKPEFCRYHGAVNRMNKAMTLISTQENPAPELWDMFFEARTEVEKAEEEILADMWKEEASRILASKETTGTFTEQEPSPDEDNSAPSVPVAKTPRPRKTRTTRPERKEAPTISGSGYDNEVFPPQVMLVNNKNQTVPFTRHDLDNKKPSGVMLAANAPLTQEQKTHLAGLMQYQHTISTRAKGKKTVAPAKSDVIVQSHSSRSVYMATQFDTPEQLKNFHEGLRQILNEGTQLRKDQTRKYEPFEGFNVVVYHTH